MNLLRRLATGLVAVIVFTLGMVVTGGTAQADCPGGSILVQGSYPIHVTYSWANIYNTDRYFYPGHLTREYGCDMDGFQVPSGKDILCYVGVWYRFSPTGWAKVSDTFRVDVPCKVVAEV